MNKGIIMEVKKNYAIALNDEGKMDKIKFKDNLKVGQKIFYFEEDILSDTRNNIYKYSNFMKTLGSIAALFLIVFTFFHTMKPQEAYAVVSLDINPSIQIEADSKLNIIKVEGVNNDGKNIDFSDIKDITLESGIQKIKDKLEEKNYLVNNKEVLVGYYFVKSGDDNTYKEEVEDIKGVINTTFNNQEVVYVEGDKESVDEAKAKSISLGRYEAARKVEDQKIKDNIDKAPVKDIAASIKDKVDVRPIYEEEDKKDNTSSSVPSATEPTTPSTSVDSGVKTDRTQEKPVINGATDNTQPNTDSSKANKDNIKPEKDKGVLEVQPDTQAQNGNADSTTNPSKDGSINVTPNNGTIENNTASGKTKDDGSKSITPEPSKIIDASGNTISKN